jgi:PKD repeat protein
LRLSHGEAGMSHRFPAVCGGLVALLIIAGLTLSLSAAPAGAVVAKIRGHAYGLTPIRGVNPARLPGVKRARSTSGTSATGPLPYDAGGQLANHGGPVMHSVTTHVIYWDPSGDFTATTKGIVHKFFADVASDSGLASNVFGIAGQYKDPSGHALYSSTVGSEGTDTTAYGPDGCTIPNEGDTSPFYSHCLTDARLQSELSAYVTTHGLHKGPTDQYFVLLPHKVVTCLPEEEGEQPCSNNFYCAYHSAINPGSPDEIIYSDIPFSLLDSEFAKSCQSDGNVEPQLPNGDAAGGDGTTRFADVALKYVSHEYIEAATDPLGNGWWENLHGQEIGDKCNFTGSGTGGDANTFLPTLGGSAASGTLFNQSINADSFYLQSEWDNVGVACLMKPLALSTAKFTASPASGQVGVPVKFSGAATDPYGGVGFSWKFGDGAEASGAVPEHAYGASGSYEVTMTAKDEFTGSTTAPVVHTLIVDEQPEAAFTFEPKPAEEGKAVKFSGAASSDPDGTITGYAWKFGDGAEGAGEAPEHTYAAAGTYTVTLTVTDSTGQTGAVTHPVNVSGVPGVTTGAPSAVGPSSVTLNATVNPHGGDVTKCTFEYGTTLAYGSNASCALLPGSGSSPVAVSASVTGLGVSTAYHFRVVAENSFGARQGGDQPFTTTPSPPTVVTGSASSVTQTASTLNATVNPNSGSVGECHFEYGTTPSYGASVSCGTSPGAGATAVAVSASVAPLAANTTYHFRAVASNAGGPGLGVDQTFTTPPNLVVQTPNPVVETFLQPLAAQPTVSPVSIANSAFNPLHATFNPKTGVITLTGAVADPGTFSWLLTFQNGKFGVFAASSAKCKKGSVRLKGKCRPSTIAFARGSKAVRAPGAVTFTAKPSASALKALKNALKQKKGLPVSVRLTFQSSRGGSAVSHTQSLTVRLKTK